MSLIRVLKTAAATLTRTFYVDETATDLADPPTVTVKRLDGTPVVTGTAVDAPGSGVYTYTLPGGPAAPTSATWQLDELVVSWTGTLAGAVVTLTDIVEVVGGYFFGLAEARASDNTLNDPVKYPTALLADKRIEVEQECERICGRAFVPRFARATVDGAGTGTLLVPHRDVRAVRAVSIDGTAVTGSALTAVKPTAAGTLERTDGARWPAGTRNVVVEVEHGLDAPPADLQNAAMRRLRSLLNATRSGIPDRASSFTVTDGGTYRLAMPGRHKTGIPDVDAVYEAYSARLPGFS